MRELSESSCKTGGPEVLLPIPIVSDASTVTRPGGSRSFEIARDAVLTPVLSENIDGYMLDIAFPSNANEFRVEQCWRASTILANYKCVRYGTWLISKHIQLRFP